MGGKSQPNIKVDWDRWVDEDDEGEGAAGGGDDMGFDMSQMQVGGACVTVGGPGNGLYHCTGGMRASPGEVLAS